MEVKFGCELVLKNFCYLWSNNKLVRVVTYTGGILTLRKIVDIVRRKWYNLPPGPVGVPFFGDLFSLFNPINTIESVKKYGPIYLTHVGFTQICMINDHSLLKKYYSSKEFLERDVGAVGFEKTLVEIPLRDNWHDRRKMMKRNVVSQLNSKILASLIKKTMKKYVFTKIDECIKNNVKWDVREECNFITFTTIYGSSFGDPCPAPSDELFIKFNNINNQLFESMPKYMLYTLLFPKIDFLTKFGSKLSGYQWCMHQAFDIIKQWCEKYDLNNDSDSDNVNGDEKADLYYPSLKYTIKNDKNCQITMDQGMADIVISFSGGMHTTSTALEQSILYLAKCGIEIQTEIYDELKNVVNGNFDQLLSKRNQLKVLSSFINEIIRKHGFIRTGAPRTIVKNDVKIELSSKKFYIIPKGTTVFSNLNGINHNKEYWENELNTSDTLIFDPKRFINKKTGELRRKTQLSTFGAGRRNCVGQELAMRELYLVISILVWNYQFDIPQTCSKKEDFVIPILFEDHNTPKVGVKVIKRE